MSHGVDSIANEYGIPPSLLRERLEKEGFIDAMIKQNNKKIISGNYQTLSGRAPKNSGFHLFGTNDSGDYIKRDKVHPINEEYTLRSNTNEFGRTVNTADGKAHKDNIGIMAATLKYLREKAKSDFNLSGNLLDAATHLYYRFGPTGGKEIVRKKYFR